MSQLIETYYQCFNRADYAGMLSLLSEDVLHEPSQGEPRVGLEHFRAFLRHMETCYSEQVIEPRIFYAEDGTRAAAEFMLEGKYLATDDGLPEARGQSYRLRVGAFFEIRDGKIARVSNHYNLQDWICQVS